MICSEKGVVFCWICALGLGFLTVLPFSEAGGQAVFTILRENKKSRLYKEKPRFRIPKRRGTGYAVKQSVTEM